MAYQLDFWQMLEANFLADNINYTLIFIFLYVILPMWIYTKTPSKIFRKMLIVVYLVVWGTCLTVWGNGWKLNNETLYMRAFFTSAQIRISEMEIGLINISSEWEPVWRTNAAGLPKLSAGSYRLANRKKAIVFNHYRQEKVLLIDANAQYYLIGNPGIEKLYEALIRLGAKEKNFGNKEGK